MKKGLTLLIVLALAGCAPNQPSDTAAVSTPQQKSMAPEFELERVAGGTLKSADLKGKVAVVDFWATWCDPCIEEIPNYNKLHETWSAKGVEVLGITVESGPLKDIQPKVEDLQMKYPVVVGNDKVIEGFGGLIGFPTTFIVDKEWRVYKKYLGMTRNKRDMIEKDLAILTAETTATP
jgi:cytochrome c biogenesis protein CcmG, thiol:disulfide interchange protein DsbE